MTEVELLLSTFLNLLTAVLPYLGTQSSAIQKVIEFLVDAIPVILKEIPALLQPVQNIIAVLSSSSAVTVDQLQTMQTIQAKIDAAFEATAAADGVAPPAT